MTADAPHILAEHRRSPALEEMFVVDFDVHINERPSDLVPYCELPWRKALEELEKVPHRYLDVPAFAPNFTPWQAPRFPRSTAAPPSIRSSRSTCRRSRRCSPRT